MARKHAVRWGVLVAAGVVALGAAQQTPPPAQTTPPAQGQAQGTGVGGRGWQGPMDESRARQLYVSNRPEDHSRPNFEQAIAAKAKEDARYPAVCKAANIECTKVTYRSSVGDFDIPAYVTRVHIEGRYGGRCEKFIVRVAGRLVVNVILGTCSVADSRNYDGTHLITAGVAEITSSSGINWTFTEVR